MADEIKAEYEVKSGESKPEETKAEEGKEGEGKKEKKDNWFKKTWGKMKTSIDNSARESNLEKKYRENADSFEIYTGNTAFNTSVTKYGKLDEEGLKAEIYGTLEKDEIPFSSILVVEPKDKDKDLPKFFYITAAKHDDADKVSLTITEKVDDKDVENTYERPLTILTLAKDVKEVKVIKVHDKYYQKLDEAK